MKLSQTPFLLTHHPFKPKFKQRGVVEVLSPHGLRRSGKQCFHLPRRRSSEAQQKRVIFCPVQMVAIGVISYQVLIYKAVYRCYNSIYHWFYKPTLLGLKGFQFEG